MTRIFIGYGYNPGTTGTYFERVTSDRFTSSYAGTPWGAKSGFRPDVNLVHLMEQLEDRADMYLYIDSGRTPYFPRGLNSISCPTACYLIDVHLGLKLRAKQARFFDHVFVAQKDYVPVLSKLLNHNQVYWLPLACDPEIHRDLNKERIYDVGFVGDVGAGYSERQMMLESLAKFCVTNDFRKYYDRGEMAEIYSRSKIVFNKSVLDDVNMRVFEAMSCGAMLLTDRVGNGLEDLFQDKSHLVTYSSIGDMLELVRYYLNHDEERKNIAQAGQDQVMTRHTYSSRLSQVVDIVLADATGRGKLLAPVRSLTEAQVHLAYAEVYSMLRLLDCVADEVVALNGLGEGRLAGLRQFTMAVARRIRHRRTVTRR